MEFNFEYYFWNFECFEGFWRIFWFQKWSMFFSKKFQNCLEFSSIDKFNSDLPIFFKSKFQLLKLWNFETSKLRNFETFKIWTLELWNSETLKLRNFLKFEFIIKVRNSEVWNFEFWLRKLLTFLFEFIIKLGNSEIWNFETIIMEVLEFQSLENFKGLENFEIRFRWKFWTVDLSILFE